MSDNDHETIALLISLCCIVPIVLIIAVVFFGNEWAAYLQGKMEESGIEIPGFESVLLLSVFGILATITIIRYHFKHEMTQ